MFRLGAKIVFLLCLLVKNMSAVSSANRWNSEESDNAVQDLYQIGIRHFVHFRFPIPMPNWQFWIKVWTYVIGLDCLMRTMLTYQKVRQVWALQYGSTQRMQNWQSCLTFPTGSNSKHHSMRGCKGMNTPCLPFCGWELLFLVWQA